MDTFLAGLTRWLSYIGIESGCSCDGHGEKAPIFSSDESDHAVLRRCLKLVSTANIHFVNGRLRLSGPLERTFKNIRPLLLDLAEAIYDKRDELSQHVKIARTLPAKGFL
jgi:hypothetical protein